MLALNRPMVLLEMWATSRRRGGVVTVCRRFSGISDRHGIAVLARNSPGIAIFGEGRVA